MEQKTVKLAHKDAQGIVIPLGPANLVAIITDVGLSAAELLTLQHWTRSVIQR